MRWLFLVLVPGCAVRQVALFEPLLVVPATRPIPLGLIATEPERVEVTKCGAEYTGLDTLIAEAQGDRDALLQVTVDEQRVYHVNAWLARQGGSTKDRTLVAVCYTLRAERVTFRSE